MEVKRYKWYVGCLVYDKIEDDFFTRENDLSYGFKAENKDAAIAKFEEKVKRILKSAIYCNFSLKCKRGKKPYKMYKKPVSTTYSFINDGFTKL